MTAALPTLSRDDLLPGQARAAPRLPSRDPDPQRSARVDRAVRSVAARGAGSPQPAGVELDSLGPRTRRPGEPRDSLPSPAAPLRSGTALFLYSLLVVYAVIYGVLL